MDWSSSLLRISETLGVLKVGNSIAAQRPLFGGFLETGEGADGRETMAPELLRGVFICTPLRLISLMMIFRRSRLSVSSDRLIWAIFLVATRTTGSSARQLQYDLGISYPTAWSWCHKIRKAMEDRDTRYTLQGMVELDDTDIGGKKKPEKRGRGVRSKVPVLVAVESRPK